MTPYPLQWPDGWPCTRAGARTVGTQTPQIGANRDQLLKELERLHASKVIISSNAVLRKDGLMAARQPKIDDPGVAVYFYLKGQFYALACDRYLTLGANLKALGGIVDKLRAIGRIHSEEVMFKLLSTMTTTGQPPPREQQQKTPPNWGTRPKQERAKQEEPPPRPKAPPPPAGHWRAVLGINRAAPYSAAHDAYRKLAKTLHPDKPGGSTEAFQKLQDAFEQAKKYFGYK